MTRVCMRICNNHQAVHNRQGEQVAGAYHIQHVNSAERVGEVRGHPEASPDCPTGSEIVPYQPTSDGISKIAHKEKAQAVQLLGLIIWR